MAKRTKKTTTKRMPAKRRVAAKPRISRQRGVAVSKTKAKPALKHFTWEQIDLEPMNPMISRHFIVGHDVMVARILLKKGGVVPLHSHVNEQITYVLEGALKFIIDGKPIIVRAGDVLAIPPNLPHAVEALEDTVDLDIFNPPRADWISRDDSYLRGVPAGISK